MTHDPLDRFTRTRSIIRTPKNGYRRVTNTYVIDFIYRVFRSIGLPILKLSIFPMLLWLAAKEFLQLGVLEKLGVTSSPDNIPKQILQFWGNVAVGIFIALPLLLIAFAWIVSIANICVSDAISGRSQSESQISSRALRSLPKMLFAIFYLELVSMSVELVGLFFAGLSVTFSGIIGVLCTWVGFTFIFIGILWFVYFQIAGSMVPIISMNEGLSPFQSLKRSLELAKGIRGMGESPTSIILMFSIVQLFVYIALLIGLALPFEFMNIDSFLRSLIHDPQILSIAVGIVAWLPRAFVYWIILPLQASGIVTIYYEARIRFEGLDIEILSSQMHQEGKDIGFIL